MPGEGRLGPLPQTVATGKPPSWERRPRSPWPSSTRVLISFDAPLSPRTQVFSGISPAVPESLQGRSLRVSEHTHEQMHSDHHQARLEHMDWLDAIRQWRLDHRRALIRLEALIDLHEAEMDSVAEAIEDHEAGGAGLDHDVLATIHEAEGKRHQKMAKDLEAMKRKHEVFVAGVEKLLKDMEG